MSERGTVVVADDEPIIRMDIVEMLEDNGYRVVGEGQDGFEAVELCRKHAPELVIMDIKMPLLDGLKAAKIIREEQLAGAVIMLTGYSDRVMIEQANEADVMGYLIKPIDEAALIPAVSIALHKQQRINKVYEQLEKTQQAFEARKTVDRAKGMLMEKQNMTENEAYSYLRKVAMDKGCTIGKIAETVIIANK